MKKLLPLALLFITVFAAQGQTYGHRLAVALSRGNNVEANIVPYASVRVCSTGSSGSPCFPLATIYSDSTLSIPIVQPTPGVVADANGNYSYYVAPATCVDEYISTPNNGITVLQNVCTPTNNGGGALFPSTPGVVCNTSTSNSTNCTGSQLSTAIGSTPVQAATVFPGSNGIVFNTSTIASRNAVSGDFTSLLGGSFIQTGPSGAQTVTQPLGSLLTVNRFSSPYLQTSAAAFGAIDDNSTDNTSAFTAMEAAASPDIFLPYISTGVYKTTQSSLSKHYWGPGMILLNSSSFSRNGNPSSVQAVRSIGLDVTAFSLIESATDFTFIGDSITDCYIAGVECSPTLAYPMRIQQFMNNRSGGIGQGLYMSGPQMGRLTKTGTTAIGTHGPLLSDLIMQAGATASFPATFVLNVLLTTWNGGGGGTITVSGLNGTWGTVVTSSGSGEVKSSVMFDPNNSTLSQQTITLTCSVGPCELTNIVAGTLPTTGNTSNFIQVVANGGYSTANFISSAVLNSIQFNRAFIAAGSSSSVALVALGTNDIYNPGTAVTPAVFKANLQTIVTGLKSRGIAPILTVPLHAGPPYTYVPVLGTLEDFRNAVYQVAETNECRVIDLGELDLAAGNLLGSDGLHPIQDGYGAIASWIISKLGFDQLQVVPFGQFANPLSVQANQTAPSRAVINLNDQNNINRGTLYAIDNTLSPVPQWTLRSTILESLQDLYLSSYGSNINFQVSGRTINALQLTSAHVTTPLPLSFGGGVNLSSSSNVVTAGTPTAGQIACIKTVGPPVVIGYCTGAISTSACTCN